LPLEVSCSFCGKDIEPGTGTMFVRNDNQRFYFCSQKCERSMLKMGRTARRIKWTKSYEKGPTPPQPEKPPQEEEPEKASEKEDSDSEEEEE